MKNRINLFLLLVLLLMSACSKEEFTDPALNNPAVSTRGEFVPLKGSMTMASVSRTTSNGINTIRFEGAGQATHLGNFTLVAYQYVYLSSPFQWWGTMVITAANRDQLFFSYSGSFTSFSPETLAFTGHSNLTVTGGTGRFSDAEGSAAMESSGVFPHFPPLPADVLTVDIEIDGSISY